MKKALPFFIMFAVVVSLMTYPLVFKANTHIPGFFSSDESYAAVWNAWWFKFAASNKISIHKISVNAYPFGIDYMVMGYPAFFINYALALLTNPTLTYNIQVLVNLFLAAAFTYLLAYEVTKDRVSSFLAGLIFGSSPYLFAHSWQHLIETYLWTLPLALWSLVGLKATTEKKFKVIFVAAIFLTAASFNAVYYTAVVAATFLLYVIIKERNVRYLRKIFLTGVIASLILLTQIYPFLRNAFVLRSSAGPSSFNPYHRPFDDLFSQSAKPLSYLLPATSHPIFGKFTEQFIGSPLYGVSYTEHTLYLGWVPLILAFVAFRERRKKRKTLSVIARPEGPKQSQKIDCLVGPACLRQARPPRNDELQDACHDDFYIGFFVWLAIVAWLFSQPPYFTFPYFKIYMPSFVMYKIFPMFRAYCRFGIVVMLAVSVLAGFGLRLILERLKTNGVKIMVTSLACSLVLFEFLNFPPFKVINLRKYPKVYDWLREKGRDLAIAEYPLDTESPNEYYRFCQTIHKKRIINGTIPGTYANRVARAIWRLSKPKTARILSWMKVKYVLVHRDAYERSNDINLMDEFEKLKTRNMAGLKFIMGINNVDVYEVMARPAPPDIKE